MIAIQVKVLPPTNTKPTRYKAIAGKESRIYGDTIDGSCPYVNAAKLLCTEFDWLHFETEWLGGMLPDNSVVFTSTKHNSQRFNTIQIINKKRFNL